jgi:hypothetical protein
MMCGFVRLGSVGPDLASRINVTGPDHANLARPGTGAELELDHGPDLAGTLRPVGLNQLHRNRLDRIRFSHTGAAAAEPRDGLESVMG